MAIHYQRFFKSAHYRHNILTYEVVTGSFSTRGAAQPQDPSWPEPETVRPKPLGAGPDREWSVGMGLRPIHHTAGGRKGGVWHHCWQDPARREIRPYPYQGGRRRICSLPARLQTPSGQPRLCAGLSGSRRPESAFAACLYDPGAGCLRPDPENLCRVPDGPTRAVAGMARPTQGPGLRGQAAVCGARHQPVQGGDCNRNGIPPAQRRLHLVRRGAPLRREDMDV